MITDKMKPLQQFHAENLCCGHTPLKFLMKYCMFSLTNFRVVATSAKIFCRVRIFRKNVSAHTATVKNFAHFPTLATSPVILAPVKDVDECGLSEPSWTISSSDWILGTERGLTKVDPEQNHAAGSETPVSGVSRNSSGKN
jgi:hypothetical protein